MWIGPIVINGKTSDYNVMRSFLSSPGVRISIAFSLAVVGFVSAMVVLVPFIQQGIADSRELRLAQADGCALSPAGETHFTGCSSIL